MRTYILVRLKTRLATLLIWSYTFHYSEKKFYFYHHFTVKSIAMYVVLVVTAHGCSTAHNSITLGDWRDPFDPDVDAQLIFSQFWLGKEQIKVAADNSKSKNKDTLNNKEEDQVFISPSLSQDTCNGIPISRSTEYHEVVSNGYIPSVYVKGYTEHHTDVTSSSPQLSEADIYQQLLTVIQHLEDEHLRASAPSTPTEIPQ